MTVPVDCPQCYGEGVVEIGVDILDTSFEPCDHPSHFRKTRTSTTLSKVRQLPVVGVSFTPDYPHNLLLLRDLDEEHRDGEPLPAVLIRNPNNPHDANAVEVHVPALGVQGMIGHVSRDNAEKLAPLLDDGVEFRCYVNWVRVATGHQDRPGVDISIQRVERE